MGYPIAATQEYLQDYQTPDGVLVRACACCNNWYEPNRPHQKYCSDNCRYAHYYDMHREEKIVYMRDYRIIRSRGTQSTRVTKKSTVEKQAEQIEELKKENIELKNDLRVALEQNTALEQKLDAIIAMLQNGAGVNNQRIVTSAPELRSAIPELPDFETATVAPEKGKAYANFMSSLSGMGARTAPVKATPKRASKPKITHSEPAITPQDTQLVATIAEAKPRQIAGGDVQFAAPSLDDLDIDF